MNRLISYLFLLALSAVFPIRLLAEEANDFGLSKVTTPLKSNKPLVSDKPEFKDYVGRKIMTGFGQEVICEHLLSRRALTGEMCAINKIINTVDVGAGQQGLEKILNDDLNDYAEFITVAKVGVAYNPIVSVRDNSCYYAAGTTAGFCIVAGSGNTVLSLDVIGLMSITFYRDGEIVGHDAVREGQSGSGINLSLVNIPGTDQTSVNLTVVAPEIFDEISLDFDGVTVGVGQLIRIKYAFVGDAKKFTITSNHDEGSIAGAEADKKYTPYEYFLIENDGIDHKNLDDATFQDKYDVELDYAKGWNPVLLGIPFPIVASQVGLMLDSDYTNNMPLTPIIGAVYMGGGKFMMKYTQHPDREVYQPGTEVGFSYKNGALLDLTLGSAIEIILFDRDGNQVQSETLEAGVLGLGVAEGGDGTAAIVGKVPFSGAEIRFYGGLKVDLGGMGIHYGFVQEAPIVRHHCPLNPSADMALCAEQTSVQLHSNPDIAVTWSLGRFLNPDGTEGINPASITPGGLVTGLSAPGRYEFLVTATDGCSDSVWINYDIFPTELEYEGTPLVNKTYEAGNPLGGTKYAVSTSHNGETSGGLLIINNLKDIVNVVGDPEQAATYSGGLKLADNNLIIGVKCIDKDGKSVDIVNYARDHGENNELKADPKGHRVGFVFSNEVVGLNAGVLHFWNIRLFKNGTEVYRHVVDESNAISAGLAGSNAGNRMRYSITVPWLDKDLKPIDFDEIQLWSSGVLDLGAGEIKIYYAFIEDASENSLDPLGCSSTLLSSSGSHTVIDYSAFGNPALVKALGAMENISNFVDDDIETSFDDVHTAGVAARTTIPVLLGRTLDFHNELGIVMRKDTYAAGVNLGEGLTVYTMYRGEKTGDTFSDWNVLGADVAGYGDKNIFYIHPTRLYDEVVIDYGQAAEVVGKTQFFGLFMRGDTDGDGIPDCRDVESCVSHIEIFDIEDVCAGESLTITAKGNAGNTYRLRFDDPAAYPEAVPAKKDDSDAPKSSKGYIEISASTETEGNVSFTYTTKTPGRYQVTFFTSTGQPIGAKMYEVHPLLTEWKVDAANSDWNNWSNWTNGTPYCCTDVIIPADARVYPVLSGANTNGDEFCCNRILMRPGASIEGVNKLNYFRAWVQLELMPNCYNLLSAPLHEMVTGDMFIPAADKGVHDPAPFTELKGDASLENRFNPTIYQRFWNSTVKEQRYSGNAYDYTDTEALPKFNSTTWSKKFNHVNTIYQPMQGFSLWVDNGNLPDDTRFRFTFPKENTVYNYYEDFSQSMIDKKENITRTPGKLGRFIYEKESASNGDSDNNEAVMSTPRTMVYNDQERKLFDLTNGLTYTFSPEQAKGENYALFGNPFMSHINSRELISANKEVITGIMNEQGTLTYDADSDEFTSTGAPESIAPMSAVFLIAKGSSAGGSGSISLTPAMILPAKNTAPSSKGVTIRAASAGMTSSVTVLTGSGMTNAALIDSEVKPKFAIYSSLDGIACDIVPARGEVPLTMINDGSGGIDIDFITYGVNREDWVLYDKADGVEYPLDHPVALPAGTGSSSGRFVLRNVSLSSMVADKVARDDIYLEVDGHEVTAVAAGAHLTAVEVFDINGVRVAYASAEGAERLSVTAPEGICIVRATADGKTSSHKLLISQ